MSRKKAFTLVELLVVLAVIGILSSFIFIQTNNAVNSGKDSKRKSDVALLASGIHVYSIGSDLITSSGCKIGVDCPENINQALIDQIGPLPSEPDSNKAYIYESDGTDCTISSVLSNGETYQYDCSDDKMSQSAPVNGQCGSAGGAGSYTIPTSNFCSDGYIPTISGEGPWTWSCPGSYLGSPANCTGYKSVNGICDPLTDGSNTETPPTTSLCTAGIPSSVFTGSDPTNYFTWSCDGEHGGTPDSCSANLKVSGECSSSATSSNYYLSSEISNPCSKGTASAISTNPTTFTWTCAGIYDGTNSGTCTANKKIDGQCGGANGQVLASPPTSSLCNAGNASASGSWSWTCLGVNTGTNSPTCSATQRQSCSALGGTMTTCGSTSCCQISGSSCPAGWSYTGYNSTNRSSYGSNGVCESVSHDPTGYAVACGASYCYYSGYHTWTTTSNSNEWVMRNNWCGLGTYYWYSTVYSVGCY